MRTVKTFAPCTNRVVSERCSKLHGCGEYLSLGTSNDEPSAVQVEMRAAELASDVDYPGEYEEVNGWWSHPDEAGIDWVIWPPHRQEYDAGYLARELATHDRRDTRDATAWPWSIDRPLAEQDIDGSVKAFLDRALRPNPFQPMADALATHDRFDTTKEET